MWQANTVHMDNVKEETLRLESPPQATTGPMLLALLCMLWRHNSYQLQAER